MTNVTVKSYRKEREAEIMGNLVKGMELVGLMVENQAKLNVTKSPPEHPQVQTGRLRASINHQVNKDSAKISVDVGTNVNYSKFLELGSVHNPPYPFLVPALEMKKAEIINILKG